MDHSWSDDTLVCTACGLKHEEMDEDSILCPGPFGLMPKFLAPKFNK